MNRFGLFCVAALLAVWVPAADETEVLKRLRERRERGGDTGDGTPAIQNADPKPASTKPAGKAGTPAPDARGLTELGPFSIVPERNIFNPNRRLHTEQPTEPKVVVVDWYALVGLMSSDKGQYALFDGSSSQYKQAVKPGGQIADYTLESIVQTGTNNFARLQKTDKQVELRVGMQFRREDGGAWKLGRRTEGLPEVVASKPEKSEVPSRSSPGSSRMSGSGLSREEILERVRKKREAAGSKEAK